MLGQPTYGTTPPSDWRGSLIGLRILTNAVRVALWSGNRPGEGTIRRASIGWILAWSRYSEAMGPFYAALDRAECSEDVVAATLGYLASWTPDMIRTVRAVAEAWSPFDARGIPLRIARPRAIYWLHRTLIAVRRSLENDGESVPGELRLLEQFLALAAARLYALSAISGARKRALLRD